MSLLRTALLSLALGAAAQYPALAAEAPGAYTFRSYGPEQGLRNQAVTGMAQDRDGFLFVATEDGLFRYDGNRFQRFGTADGLLSDSIISTYREPGGRLWIVNAKGAVAWSGAGPDPALKAPLLPNHRIESIAASSAGHLLVSTTEGLFEGAPEKMAPLKGVPHTDPGAVWLSPDGRESLVTAGGRLYRRVNDGKWESRALMAGASNELIHTLIKDAQGRIWIRGRRILFRLDNFQGPMTDLSDQLPGSSVLRGQLVTDARGGVWTTTNLGLVRFDERGSTRLTEQDGLPSQWLTSMLFDREGNLWVASEGVHRLQGRLAWAAYTKRQKLPSDTVWSIGRSADGVLWAGTNRGLARLDGKQWQLEPDTEERSLYAFAVDSAGNFWVGGNNAKAEKNALMLRPAGSNKFIAVPLAHIEGPSTVNTMDFGADGALYIGTQAHGMHRVVKDGAGYRSEAVALPEGDPKEQINYVLRGPKGQLWVAGMAGLAYFDGSTWRRYGTAHGLREVHVEALAMSMHGELWVSYWNIHGLTRFPTTSAGLGKPTQIDNPPGLVADNIYSMGFDAVGALWLGTAQGAKRFKDGRLDRYGRGEGLPSEDAAANAFFADRNGDVWLGMASGLAHFNAGAEPLAPPHPPTRVLRLQDGSGKVRTEARPQVDWAERTLTYHFAVLSFVNEARVRAQVRLVGFEDEWRDTDIREARYTGLPPGAYRFEVRASMGDEQFGPVSQHEVVILAPWWRTGWAWTLAILAGAALLFLVVRWRLGRLRARNSELEELVSARTAALELANAALQEASMVDPLTGLKNRRFLGLTMPDELARVQRQLRSSDHQRGSINRTLLFYMVDVDHFKAVNDSFGHAAGDLVLQQTSAALRAACRDADFVVRWGGEEFLIVARNADRGYAEQLASKLRDAVRAQQIDIGDGVLLQKTCSIGFAAFPAVPASPDAHPWEDVVKMADQCLYAAKLSGRDAWVGLVLPEDAADPGPRLATALGELALDGQVELVTSLAPGAPLRWR